MKRFRMCLGFSISSRMATAKSSRLMMLWPSLSSTRRSRPRRNLAVRSPGWIEAAGEIAVQSRSRTLRMASSASAAGLEVGGCTPFSAMWSKWVRPSLRIRLPAPTTNRQRFTPDFLITSITRPMSFSFHFTEMITASWPFRVRVSAGPSLVLPARTVTPARGSSFLGSRVIAVTS